MEPELEQSVRSALLCFYSPDAHACFVSAALGFVETETLENWINCSKILFSFVKLMYNEDFGLTVLIFNLWNVKKKNRKLN